MEDIVCKRCGAHAASGEAFCGGCGAFLEWEGEVIAEPPAPTPDLQAESAGGLSPDRREEPPEPIGRPAASSEAASPPSVDADAAEKPARGQPIAVQPAVPLERPKPPSVLERPTRWVDPNAISCEACGEANAPERRFCRRCGAVLGLVAPIAAVRLPWWKRLFGPRAAQSQSGGPAQSASRQGAQAQPPTAPGQAGASSTPASGGPQPARAPQPPAMPKAPTAPGQPPRMPSVPKAVRPPTVPSAGRRIAPAGLPRSGAGGKIGKGVLVLVMVAVIAFAAVPSLRHKITNAFSNLVTKAQPLPLAGAPITTGYSRCGTTLIGPDNSTLYWYTGPRPDGPESVTIQVAPTFSGSLTQIVFTQLVANSSTTLVGVTPYPRVLTLSSRPSGKTTNIVLQNMKVQGIPVSVHNPTTLTLRLVASTSGAALSSCAELGIVFEGKKG